MDINKILDAGGYVHNNPEYNPKTKKGKIQPKYLVNADPNGAINQGSALADVMSQPGRQGKNLDYLGSPEKYARYDVTISPIDANLNDELAEAQSNFSKLFNSLSQTVVSEIGIGTAKAFSDVADAVVNGIGSAILDSNNDYTNPVSKVLEEWKESFEQDVAPVYVQEGVDISNGGFANFGWWMKNMPSIASSLTLMIPGKALTTVASKVARSMTKGRATMKAMKALQKATGIEGLTSSQAIQNVKTAEDIIGTALVMRTAENYQEARGTYTEMKEDTLNKLNNMSEQEYNYWVSQHKDLFKDGTNPADKDAVAERIASKAANTTFREDFANTVFDVIQLWALRDASKIFRNVKSTKVMADHRASIEALGKSSEELAEAAAKSSKFGRLSDTVSDVIRGTGKAVLGESTEGIEEAVNYIAQQEGLTVGKTLLEDIKPTTFGQRLESYMSDPQLWESAFWGLAGGIVFQGLGSVYNQAKVKRASKKAAKERELNNKTGEEIKTSNWYELEELPEIKAARSSISRRKALTENMVNQITDINSGKNIFAPKDPTTKETPMFEGSADSIAIQQERARQTVLDQYIADITTDAVHSGTAELLEEYIGSEEMKKAMIRQGIVADSEASSFINNMVSKVRNIKDEYNKQINHISQQVAAINAETKNKDAVPLPYIQILAKQNLDRILANKNLDSQASTIQEQINVLRSNPAFDGLLEADMSYEDIATVGAITNTYVNLEAKKKRIKADDTVNPLTVAIQVDSINKKQKKLLDRLEEITQIGKTKSSPLGRILYTVKYASGLKYDEQGKLVEDKDYIEKTDKEILKEHGYTVTDAEAEDAAKGFSEYEDTLSAFSVLHDLAKQEIDEANKAAKELKDISDQLYTRYNTLADIRIAKIMNTSDIAVSKKQIAEQIDIIHNQNNENRQKMLAQATNKLVELYDKYDRGTIDELAAIYINGEQETAKALAKERLTKDSQDAVNFADTFDILHLNSDNNIQLARYIKTLIDGKEYRDSILRKTTEVDNKEGESSSTSEEQISEEETKKPISSSEENDESDTGEGNTLNPAENGQGEQGQGQKPVIPNGATPLIKPYKVADQNVASMTWSEGGATFYNDKGTHIGGASMSAEEFEKLTGVKPTTNSSTGREESRHINDLKAQLNQTFDYLKIKGAEDIKADKDFDVDAAVDTVTAQAKAFIENENITDEAKEELNSILQDRADDLRKRLTKFKEVLNEPDPTIDDAATGLALASKIGIIGNDSQLPNIFVVGFENFVDVYLKTAITPIKDGKKVISIREILSIVSKSVGDPSIAGYVLDKLRTYLKSPEVAAKYVVLDPDNINKEYNVDNTADTAKAVEREKGQFRINILDYINFYDSEEADTASSEEFFKVLNSLRKGDKLKLIVDGKTLFVQAGDTIIGSITKGSFENNMFIKTNMGWVEDVTINAGGDISSNIMNLYKDILTSDKKKYAEIRDVILSAVIHGKATKEDVAAFKNTKFVKDQLDLGENGILSYEGKALNDRDAANMINHLVRIYNYSTQNVGFKTKKDRINNINYAITGYFMALFNDLDVLHRINKNTDITVEYINDGSVNEIFGNRKAEGYGREKLPVVSNSLVQSKGRVAVYTKTDETIHISGEDNGTNTTSFKNTTKVLAMFDRNGAVHYTTLEQLLPNENKISSGYNKILTRVKNHIENLIDGLDTDSSTNAFNTLMQVIGDLFDNNLNHEQDVIPLFARRDGVNVNRRYDASNKTTTFQLSNYFKGHNFPIEFSFQKTTKGFTFRYRLDQDIQGQNSIYSTDPNASHGIMSVIMDIVEKTCYVNVDPYGIKLDNNPSKVISRGFIQKRNNKVMFFDEEYDSYSDFLIANGMFRVDLAEPKHGSNYVAIGKEQKLNQVMYVSTEMESSLPVEENVDTTKYNTTKPTTDIDEDIYNRVAEAFTKDTVTGKDLFIAAFGEEAYADMINTAKEFDIVEAILPLDMIYNPNLNAAKSSTLEAKTNPTNRTIRVNVGNKDTASHRTRVNLTPGQVMVGDKFLSLIASNNGYLRNRALAVMMHERLHYLIQNNPNYTREQILNAIKPIYDAFFSLCQKEVDNYNESTATEEQKLRYERAKKAINDFKKYNNIKTYPDPLTKFDEFLVETITNVDYNALMNYFDATEQTEEGEKNIFTKLLEFIMKYLFNREIRDNSLLKQEFNTLNKLVNDEKVTVPAENKTVVTVPGKDKGTFKPLTIKMNINEEEDEDDGSIPDIDDLLDEDSSNGILSNYADGSVTGFVTSLPIEQQAKFQSLLNNDEINYICKIK